MQLEIKHLMIILLIVAIIWFPLGLITFIGALFHGMGVILTHLFGGSSTTPGWVPFI